MRFDRVMKMFSARKRRADENRPFDEKVPQRPPAGGGSGRREALNIIVIVKKEVR